MLPFLGRSDACLVDEESLLVIVTGDASVVEVAQSGDRQLRAEGGSRITVEKIETYLTRAGWFYVRQACHSIATGSRAGERTPLSLGIDALLLIAAAGSSLLVGH